MPPKGGVAIDHEEAQSQSGVCEDVRIDYCMWPFGHGCTRECFVDYLGGNSLRL